MYKIDETTNKHSWKTNSKKFIMLHHTGNIASLENMVTYLSKNPTQVSAHYVVGLNWDIGRIWTDDYVLWHAGTGDLIEGHIDNMNAHSIWIEVISNGTDFTKKQIDSLVDLVRDIKDRNNISIANIIRHKDYSTRKWDIWDNFYKPYSSFEEWKKQLESPLIPEDDTIKSDADKFLERGLIENPELEKIVNQEYLFTVLERVLQSKEQWKS